MRNISQKELNYIKDFLSWELLAAKKCYQYGHQEPSSTVQQTFFDAAHVHEQNYLNLLNYVDQLNKTQGGQVH